MPWWQGPTNTASSGHSFANWLHLPRIYSVTAWHQTYCDGNRASQQHTPCSVHCQPVIFLTTIWHISQQLVTSNNRLSFNTFVSLSLHPCCLSLTLYMPRTPAACTCNVETLKCSQYEITSSPNFTICIFYRNKAPKMSGWRCSTLCGGYRRPSSTTLSP